MPIYTFKCAAGHVFDAIVPYDTKTTKCEVSQGSLLGVIQSADRWFSSPCRLKAKRIGIEACARRNPQHGIQK